MVGAMIVPAVVPFRGTNDDNDVGCDDEAVAGADSGSGGCGEIRNGGGGSCEVTDSDGHAEVSGANKAFWWIIEMMGK